MEELCKPSGYLCLVFGGLSLVVKDPQEAPEFWHTFGALMSYMSCSLGFDAIGTDSQAHIFNLGVASLTFGECQFCSSNRELIQPDLCQMFLKDSSPHEVVFLIDEVKVGGSITHCIVE